MKHSLQQGFTLIEMLVIAPIVVLAIGAFLTVIISMTGEVLSSRGANTLAYNVQDALNRIDQDVKLSTTFLATNNITLTASDKQGYNNDATNFTNVGGSSGTSLILNALVTTDNPTSLTSGLVYLTDKPNACASNRIQDNTPMSMNIVYFVKDNTLWRRTIMDPAIYNGGTARRCSTPWQQPSCAPGTTSPMCITNDVKLVEGVSSSGFSLQYFTSASSTSANATASDTAATTTDRGTALQSLPTVGVAITASQNIAGRTVERASSLRSTRLDTNASTIANYVAPTTPSAPALSGAVSAPTSVVYTWPKVNGADNYTFQYNINGGAWQTPVSNQNVNTYTVTAGTHTDVIRGRVTATNSAGTSAYSTETPVTIPRFANLQLQSGWADYGPPWAPSGYTKTSAGLVVLKGLIKKAANSAVGETIAVLPVGYRPSQNYIFQKIANSANTDIRVQTNGTITISSTSTDVSLDGIAFQPSSTSFTTLTPMLNGWGLYGDGTYALAPGYFVDNTGRVEIRAMIAGGTNADGTDIVTLPAAATPSKYHHMPAIAGGANGTVGVGPLSPGPALEAKGNSNAWYSIHSIYWPSSRASGGTYNTSACTTQWCNLPLANGWVLHSAPYTTPEYTKASDGMVSIKGLLAAGTATNGTVLATLPAGYRPGGRLLLNVQSCGALGRVDITADGQIIFIIGSNCWFSLDGINFMAEN